MENIIENYLNNTNKYSAMKSNVNKAFNLWLYEIIVNDNVLYFWNLYELEIYIIDYSAIYMGMLFVSLMRHGNPDTLIPTIVAGSSLKIKVWGL